MGHISTTTKLDLGQTTITRAALAAIGEDGALEALSRHAVCDWGETTDVEANEEALESGARLLSIYMIKNTKIWVITDAETDVCPACWAGVGVCEPDLGEWIGGTHFRTDRPMRRLATTILLPEDY